MLNAIIESLEKDITNKNKIFNYLNKLIRPIKYYLILLIIVLLFIIYYIINIDIKLKIIKDNIT